MTIYIRIISVLYKVNNYIKKLWLLGKMYLNDYYIEHFNYGVVLTPHQLLCITEASVYSI